jgi:dTDP-4-amino-4,6-dideoxygalactose transaminase
MNDITASIIRTQLKRSSGILNRRKQIFHKYRDALQDVCGVAPLPQEDYTSSYYFF